MHFSDGIQDVVRYAGFYPSSAVSLYPLQSDPEAACCQATYDDSQKGASRYAPIHHDARSRSTMRDTGKAFTVLRPFVEPQQQGRGPLKIPALAEPEPESSQNQFYFCTISLSRGRN
jgi:hypothetical protein